MSHNTYTINNKGADVTSYHGEGLGVLYLGHGSTQTYPATLNTGDLFEWYDPNPINTIGATLRTGSASDWYDQITLPAGTYWIRAYHNAPVVYAPSAGRMRIGLELSTVNENLYHVTNAAGFSGVFNVPKSLNSRFTLATSTALTFSIDMGSATVSSTGRDRISESQYLFIKRLA